MLLSLPTRESCHSNTYLEFPVSNQIDSKHRHLYIRLRNRPFLIRKAIYYTWTVQDRSGKRRLVNACDPRTGRSEWRGHVVPRARPEDRRAVSVRDNPASRRDWNTGTVVRCTCALNETDTQRTLSRFDSNLNFDDSFRSCRNYFGNQYTSN